MNITDLSNSTLNETKSLTNDEDIFTDLLNETSCVLKDKINEKSHLYDNNTFNHDLCHQSNINNEDEKLMEELLLNS